MWMWMVHQNNLFQYWMYKFRDVTPKNMTMLSHEPEVRKTPFQAEFTSYLNVASAVPNLLFLILNSLYGHLWVYFILSSWFFVVNATGYSLSLLNIPHTCYGFFSWSSDRIWAREYCIWYLRVKIFSIMKETNQKYLLTLKYK